MAAVLVDHYGRVIDYLRVSITDLCNFRCVYCRPPEGVKLIPHDEILRYEEILAIVGVAQEMGIHKIRVTGGEPLVRRGVLDFIARLTRLPGIRDVALTTNGVRLREMAHGLKAAGLTRINVSLDSLRRDTFKQITGSDHLQQVLAGIDAAMELGFHPMKINVVLLKGMNEDDVPAFSRLTLESPIDVRFIERMPFGSESLPSSPDSFCAREVIEIIQKEVGALHQEDRGPSDGPATMFRLEGAQGRLGIIDPVTGHFCGTCNRLRLTARGTLRPCLLGLKEIDIKRPFRHGASREELAHIIRSAVAAKPGSNCARKTPMNDTMNLIGG